MKAGVFINMVVSINMREFVRIPAESFFRSQAKVYSMPFVLKAAFL